MSRKFLTNLNLNKNELQNAKIQNLGAAPGSPVTGQLYYDTGTNAAYIYNGTTWRPCDAAKLTDGSIANSALTTNPLARANHTGTQLASTVSDFDTQVRTSRLDQMASPTADVSVNSYKVTNVATPTASGDAANKQYVDDNVAGLSWKDEVKAASTGNGTLATAYENGDTLDGYTLNTGDRILLKDQTAGAENGLYIVNASGAPTRTTDGDTAAEIQGLAVYVVNGTVNQGTRWVNNNTGSITLNTTALTFAQFGGGSSYTAGNGLTLTVNDFNVGAGTGITVNANDVAIDTSVVVRKYATDVGDNSSTSITVTHNLGTRDVTVSVHDAASTYDEVECDVQMATTNTITLIFVTAPTTNQYRCVVHG